MKKLETISAYINLISEVIFMGIAVVIMGILIDFKVNFKALLELAAGL